MQIKEITRLLGITNTTLGNWIKTFDLYFSEGAKLKQRQFTQDDLIILATISKLSRDGLNYDAIKDRLASGERAESLSDANAGVDTRLVPAAAVEQMIDATEIRKELETTKEQLDFYKGELAKRDSKIEELQSKMDELRDRAARAEGRLEEIERQRQEGQNKRKWWGG